jgi:hypothetical protein
MQAIYIRVPHVRDSLIVANVGKCSYRKCPYKNRLVILSGAHSAEKPALSEVEGKDLWLSLSPRRICR